MKKRQVPFITIAVLPFDNLSEDRQLQIFCDGFAYDLVTELSHFKQFQIICLQTTGNAIESSHDEALPYETNYFVRGSFRSFGDRVRINAQLIDTKTGRLAWADRFEDTLESLFFLQEELQQRLVASLQQYLDIDLLTHVRKHPTTNIKAYEYWLYGLNELKKGSVAADEQARQHFEKALAIDPNYSLAYSGMSLTYFNEWSCQLWDRWDLSQKGAKEWAEKALQFDGQNYIANLVIGRVYLFEQHFDTAEIYLKKALTLNPNDPFNLIQIAQSFVFLGYLDEAEDLYKKTLRLNPVNEETYHLTGALIYFEKGDYQQCLEVGAKYAAISWVDYPAIIAAAYYYLGDLPKAMEFWQLYLNNFKEKIAKDENKLLDPVRWMIEVNPYKNGTNYKEFWQYISGIDYEQVTSSGEGETPSLPGQNLFRKEGEVWTFAFENDQVQLPDTKGFQDIARLLARPNEQLHCSELIGSAVIEHAGEMIDEKAKKAYQKKILDLQKEIGYAEENNDLSRANSLQEEYDQLLQHLSSSLDIKGKSRKFQRSADKARSAVTQRIRGSIKKIESVHPALAKHLSVSIKTGTYCSYSPEKEITWIL